MKKRFLLCAITALMAMQQPLQAQKKLFKETTQQKADRMQWWTNDRFGMFIHWGLYAMPARHEWVRNAERLTDSAYQKYFDYFNPDLYNPKDWAKMAKAAGMKYAVLTAKHHEGFCLFDSKFTEYKSTNTPIKKDLVKEYVDAFRAEGIKVGFYYSLIDWHHPDFTIDRNHSQRVNTPAEYEKLNKGRDMAKYREYLKNQVRELLTNYGKIDILWLDFSYPGQNGKGKDDWGSIELIKMVRQLQPQIIVNDRLDLKEYDDAWDFVTPEQYKVASWPKDEKGNKLYWETCQTFSGSWGYHRDENTWKSTQQLLVLLIESVSKGGNLLLNVGPTARGMFDYRAQNALGSMGEWMKFNAASIYGCTEAPAEYNKIDQTLLTYNPKTKRLYVHLVDYPLSRLVLPGYEGKVKYAQFLHDNSEIKMTASNGHWDNSDYKKGDLTLILPVTKPNVEIPVIELVLAE
ncbi:alpha-L-fucosidase [Chitinophaga skermanii]|uniref:alpha-L-fucosidase n=1 Tax=Chitinophaga skermanii TaxID=331697 RepID=A0A327R435_9BACT|nr:alpha-L-fucosidase [Chitinophaga skermanii]RAJ10975.1 alpha-L-fucosidase [Chitinophaga skermanii]